MKISIKLSNDSWVYTVAMVVAYLIALYVCKAWDRQDFQSGAVSVCVAMLVGMLAETAYLVWKECRADRKTPGAAAIKMKARASVLGAWVLLLAVAASGAVVVGIARTVWPVLAWPLSY